MTQENKKLKMSELGRSSVDEFKAAQKIPITVVLDNVRSLNNVGSVFRTADAFAVARIFLCGITAKPPHRDIQKTALGATESVDWKYFKTTEEAIEKLKAEKVEIWSIEQTTQSTSLSQFVPNQETKYAIVLGNEVKGVQQSVIDSSDGTLEIDQFGTKHSLNISVCAGIVLYDLSSKMRLQKKKG